MKSPYYRFRFTAGVCDVLICNHCEQVSTDPHQPKNHKSGCSVGDMERKIDAETEEFMKHQISEAEAIA